MLAGLLKRPRGGDHLGCCAVYLSGLTLGSRLAPRTEGVERAPRGHVARTRGRLLERGILLSIGRHQVPATRSFSMTGHASSALLFRALYWRHSLFVDLPRAPFRFDYRAASIPAGACLAFTEHSEERNYFCFSCFGFIRTFL